MGRAEKEHLCRVLSSHLNNIHETFQLLDQTPASSLDKVSWEEVIKLGWQVSKQATIVGMLWTGEVPEAGQLEETIGVYCNLIQGFLLLSHGSMVGAGPTLSSTIHASAKQVVDCSFSLLKEAVSSYGSCQSDNSLSIPQLTGAVWNACGALKKTPTTNYTAIGRAITQVAVSVKDVLRELKELKPGATDPTDETLNEPPADVASEPHSSDSASEGDFGMDFAAKHCNGDAISLLLREGAFALHTNLRGETAIHHLCKSSNFTPEPGLLSLITTIGVDHEDYRGYTPLVYALIENRYDTIDCLIASGASLKFADRKNILHYAAAYSNSGMLMNLYCLKLSAKDGVDVEAKDDDGNTVWDTFLTSLYGGEFWGGDSWDAPYRRLVDYGERMRFLEVFEGVRDRNLQHDIANLQQALGALDTNDIPSSCFQLCTLSKQKAYCNNEDAALLYQGFQYEIEAGDVESARLKIKDQLNCLTKKLKSSPWKELGPWSQKYLDERDYIATLTVADEFA